MSVRCIYKYELADRIGIGKSTLRRWLNQLYYQELASLGYQKTQKVLNAKQLNFLAEKLDFDPNS